MRAGCVALDSGPMSITDLLPQAEYWAYQLGGFLILNVLDDPAWLALMFC